MKQYPDFFASYSSAHRPLTTHTNHILEKYGLSGSYWRVLRVLENGESKSFHDIANSLNIEKPSVTNTIKKLADLEIVKIYSGQDKRVKLVTLTPTGKEKIVKIREDLNEFFKEALKGLSAEQLETAMDVLDTIRENIIKL